MDYAKYKVNALKALCVEKGFKGLSGKKKGELIQLLTGETPVVNEIIDTALDFTSSYTVGDNLELLKGLPHNHVDMIYMDPPYNTGRNFYYFQDKFADFPKFMEERLTECYRVLKPTGNIIIHVEPKISHHIRVICDKLFGESNFKNEIVWLAHHNLFAFNNVVYNVAIHRCFHIWRATF